MRSWIWFVGGALSLACSSTTEIDSAAVTPKVATASAPAMAAQKEQKPAAKKAKERSGVLVPVDYEAISIWPETYTGSLLVSKAVEHGTRVDQGDVILELVTRPLDEMMHDAKVSLGTAEMKHLALVERHQLAAHAAHAALERSKADLDRAERTLAGYLENELAFSDRSRGISTQRESARIEDQVDELEQLQAMYQADELTDATEDIVLKRARRGLALLRESVGLNQDQRRHQKELREKIDIETREESVEKKRMQLAHVQQTQQIEQREREDASRRSQVALDKARVKLARLERDQSLLAVKAPRSGVVLYGKTSEVLRGKATPILRGGKLAMHSEFCMVADPSRMGVAVEISESDSNRFHSGTRATAIPKAHPGLVLEGTLELEEYPRAGKNGEGVYDGVFVTDQAPGELRFGMHATVTFAGEKVEG